MVRAPAEIADVGLRRGADLGEDAVGLATHRGENGGVAVDLLVVFQQAQKGVFALPEISPGAVGLRLRRRATDRAVGALGGEDVRDSLAHPVSDRGVGKGAEHHAAGAHELAPHLAGGELRASFVEKPGEIVVRNGAEDPAVD